LGYADTHLLKVTQTPSLAVGGTDTNIGKVVEHVDILITETHILGAQHEAIGETLHGDAAQTQLARKDFKQPPSTLFTLVADTHQENGLGGVFDNQLHKRHHEEILTLARLVAIQRRDDEGFLRQTEFFTNLIAGHGREDLLLKPVADDVNRASNTLILETLPPVLGEGKHTIRIAVQNIKESLRLAIVDLVHIDPDLEIARNAALADFLQKSRHHGHVVVDQNYVRLLMANHVRKHIESKALEARSVGCRAALFHIRAI